MKRILLFCLPLLIAGCSTASEVQPLSSTPEDPINRARVEGFVFQPERVDATDARVAELRVPEGFTIEKYAEDMGKPRMLAVRDDGTVYVTRREGDIYMLKDADGDGRADSQEKIFEMKNIHGLALRGDELYMMAVNEIMKTSLRADGTFGPIDTIAREFPEGGQHNNRTIAFGPDGMLYASVGSTCNACKETNDENATMVRMNADGSERKIFAKGLRNTIGFDWHPETGAFYGLDHGIDWLGDDAQREELNLLEDGKHYGWPYIYEDGEYNPADEPDEGFAAFEKKVTSPVLTYTAHSAPLDLIFYRGDQFPAEYRNDAIVTLRGSWNRSEPSGYKIVRITFDDTGQPTGFEDFATGWLRNKDQQQMGRLVGLAEMPDGSLLATDDTNGIIYRIAYGTRSR